MNTFSHLGIYERPAIVRSVSFYQEQEEQAFVDFLDEWDREERSLLMGIDGGDGYLFNLQVMNDREVEELARKEEKWNPDFRKKLRND